MKTYYKVTGKTCQIIHAELRKIGDLINPIPNKEYHIPKLMTKARRLLLIASICEKIKNNR